MAITTRLLAEINTTPHCRDFDERKLSEEIAEERWCVSIVSVFECVLFLFHWKWSVLRSTLPELLIVQSWFACISDGGTCFRAAWGESVLGVSNSISIASSWTGDEDRWLGCQYPAAYPPLRGSDSALRPALYRTTACTTAPMDFNTSIAWFFTARPSKMACGSIESGLCLAKTTCVFRTTKENIKKISGWCFTPTLKDTIISF